MKCVKHFGVFKFKPYVIEEEQQLCFKQLASLVDKIQGLIDFKCGPYESDEGFNQGFSHGFIMTFDNVQNRDRYLNHPDHEEVKEFVVPLLADFVVFDFVVR